MITNPGGLIFDLISNHDVVLLTNLFPFNEVDWFLKHFSISTAYNFDGARFSCKFIEALLCVITSRAQENRLA